jgi:hypothetical protein
MIILFFLGKILAVVISSHLSSRSHDRCSQCRPIFLFLLANIIIIASRMSSRRHDRRSQCLPIFLFLSPSQHSPPGSPMQYCNVESTGNPPLRVLIVDVD